MPYADIGRRLQQSAMTSDDISWIRAHGVGRSSSRGSTTSRTLGVPRPSSAGLVISDHGGRRLDRVLPTLHVLRRVAPAMKDCGWTFSWSAASARGATSVVAWLRGQGGPGASRLRLRLGAGGATDPPSRSGLDLHAPGHRRRAHLQRRWTVRRLLRCVASPSCASPACAVRSARWPSPTRQAGSLGGRCSGPASHLSPCRLMVGWSCSALQVCPTAL